MRNRNKILVVDDSKMQQLILKSLLGREGFSVFISSTVSDGLKIIGTEDIGIVLVDFYLAGINTGAALVDKIRRYGVDVLIFAISGSEENNQELLSAGCDGVISKNPLEIRRFIISLKENSLSGDSE